MPKSDIWMPWYPADYLRDTITLTLEEDAVYRRALDFLWQNPTGIPNETQRLSLALRISKKEAEKYKKILQKYLVFHDGFYHSERINREREKMERYREKQRNNGILGGRPRKEKTHGLFLANPTPNPAKSSSYSYSELNTNTIPPLPPKGGISEDSEKENEKENTDAWKFDPWFKNPELKAAWDDWGRERKKRGAKRNLAVLKTLSEGDIATATAILKQSADNQWRGLFPLRGFASASKTNKNDGNEWAAAEIEASL